MNVKRVIITTGRDVAGHTWEMTALHCFGNHDLSVEAVPVVMAGDLDPTGINMDDLPNPVGKVIAFHEHPECVVAEMEIFAEPMYENIRAEGLMDVLEYQVFIAIVETVGPSGLEIKSVVPKAIIVAPEHFKVFPNIEKFRHLEK